MITDIDINGGFTVYQNEVPLMRWYYTIDDNGKYCFEIIYLNVDPITREHLLDDEIWIKNTKGDPIELGGDFYLCDHLTGTCIPNDKYFTHAAWGIPTTMRMVLYLCLRKLIQNKSKSVSFLQRTQLLGRQFLIQINILFKSLRYFSVSKLSYQILCKNVQNYLSTQDFAVIDLRRGEDHRYIGEKSELIIDFGIDSLYNPCPLKKEYIEHIKSFAIALPGKCNSKVYRQLRSSIASDKVIEVTIFRPQDINEIIEYQNIERLYLLYASQELDLKGIESFTKLKKIFISGDIELTEREELKQLRNKIDIEFAIIGEGYYKGAINTKFIQWSCTCPRDVK
jgi:hypothetical protein